MRRGARGGSAGREGRAAGRAGQGVSPALLRASPLSAPALPCASPRPRTHQRGSPPNSRGIPHTPLRAEPQPRSAPLRGGSAGRDLTGTAARWQKVAGQSRGCGREAPGAPRGPAAPGPLCAGRGAASAPADAQHLPPAAELSSAGAIWTHRSLLIKLLHHSFSDAGATWGTAGSVHRHPPFGMGGRRGKRAEGESQQFVLATSSHGGFGSKTRESDPRERTPLGFGGSPPSSWMPPVGQGRGAQGEP